MMREPGKFEQWLFHTRTFWGTVRALLLIVLFYVFVYNYESILELIGSLFGWTDPTPTPAAKIAWHRLVAAAMSSVWALFVVLGYVNSLRERNKWCKRGQSQNK